MLFKYKTTLFEKVDNYLRINFKLGHLLFILFDFGSKVTRFIVFDLRGYIPVMLLIICVPVAYAEEFVNFLIALRTPENIFDCLKHLPLALKGVFFLYIFIFDLVFFCTFLACIPSIKEKMIEKYKNTEIMKIRGYNVAGATARTIMANMGLPAVAAILMSGDVIQSQITTNAIIENNRMILETYPNPDSQILERLQKIQTPSTSMKLHNVTVGIKDFLVNWEFGSKTPK